MRPESQNPAAPGADQGALLSYAVLTGLTPLIPIPFVDDLAKGYFRRRLVHTLAMGHGVRLTPEAVQGLSSEPQGCLVSGCLSQVFLYPLRKIFRKIFYFLEWKRALDLTSQTYHFGYLVDCALRDGYVGPSGSRSVEEVRRAIEAVCREAPIKPIEGAVAATFRQSKSVLTSAVRSLERSLRSLTGRPQAAEVEAKLESVEEQERQEVAGVAQALGSRLQAVPQAHFQALRDQLRARLG